MAGELNRSAILVAEDDPALRRLVCRFLREMGHPVLEASSGEEALHLASDHHDRIGLVLTDVRMPGMSGCELARAVLCAEPSVSVVYMSGYVDVELEPRAPLVRKPFHLAALAEAVRDALARAALRPLGQYRFCP